MSTIAVQPIATGRRGTPRLTLAHLVHAELIQARSLLVTWGLGGLSVFLAALTSREREIFDALVEGLTNAEIAERLYVSETTVKTHVGNVLAKLDLRDRVQVVIWAYANRLAG